MADKIEYDIVVNGTRAKQAIQEVEKAQESLSAVTDKTTSLMSSNWVKLGAAALATKEAFDMAKEFNSLMTGLENATGSAEAARNKFGELYTQANKMGLSVQTLAESYTSFRQAAELSGFSIANTEKIFNSVTTASAAMGLSADDTKGALLALSQMIGKGKVSAEELRGQFGERIPAAMSLAAQAMGMTISQLDGMMAKGELMASDLLPKLADALENKFASKAEKAAGSLSATYQRLGNVFTELQGVIYTSLEKTGMISFFSKAVNVLDEYTNKLSRVIKTIDEMNMAERDKERLSIIKQISEQEEKISNAYSWNKGIYEADLRNLKMKLMRIDDLNKSEKENLDIQKKTSEENAKRVQAENAAADAKKKADEEWKKGEKERQKLLEDKIKAYQEMGKAGLSDYDQKLYDIAIKTKEWIKDTGDVKTALEAQANAVAKLNEEEKKKQETKNKEEVDKQLQKEQRIMELKEKQLGLIDDETSKNIQLARLYTERQKAELKASLDKKEIDETLYNQSIAFEDELLKRTEFRYSQIGQIISGVSGSMEDSFMTFLDHTSDKFMDFGNLVNSIMNSILQQIIKTMIVQPLVSAATSGATSLFSANGNVFTSGNHERFATGGVVSKTTRFATGGGVGIMGERGSEAIMPLARTASGDLGVATVGSGDMKVEIINNSSEQMQVTNATTRNDISGQIISIVIDGIQTNKQGLRTILGGR